MDPSRDPGNGARRIIRGEITYSAAKERETNVLHALGYWDQRNQYFKHLDERRDLLQAAVDHHLNLASSDECRVSSRSEWLHGSLNVCIPVYLKSREQAQPSLLVRMPLPYRVGEKPNPGNGDEKIRCEAGTYAWVQQNCPEIPIPQLFGFGLSTGQTVCFPPPSFERLLRSSLRISIHCPSGPIVSNPCVAGH